jgi:hypothetical protein
MRRADIFFFLHAQQKGSEIGVSPEVSSESDWRVIRNEAGTRSDFISSPDSLRPECKQVGLLHSITLWRVQCVGAIAPSLVDPHRSYCVRFTELSGHSEQTTKR